MNIVETRFPGLLKIEPDVYFDQRGHFYENFHYEKYSAAGIPTCFKQDNISFSVKNTVRGLHYQVGDFAQGKLCQVIKGVVQDFAVDLRHGSPTFGQWYGVILSDENHTQLWIPPGFAHGFAVYSDGALFHYKCSEVYNKASERTLLFNDTDLNVEWEVESPIISEKDLLGVRFKDLGKDFIF